MKGAPAEQLWGTTTAGSCSIVGTEDGRCFYQYGNDSLCRAIDTWETVEESIAVYLTPMFHHESCTCDVCRVKK